MARPIVRAQVFSRRQLLLRGGAAFAGAHLLPGCDRLVLPDGPPLTEIDPITANERFYVTSSAGTPTVDRHGWSLTIEDGGVLATIDAAFLEGLDARDTERTLQCIGSGPSNQAISNALWSGLPLPEVLAELGIELRASALQIVMYGADGYATALPRADVDRPMWLVWRMNGEDLPPQHGFPARLLSPGRYGTKNVKWLERIVLVDQAFVGFWESRGWSDDATYRANTFVQAPTSRTTVEGGATVLGTAFAGEDPVVSVDISLDDGATWVPATITYGPGPGIWALWQYDFAADPGDYTIRARCTTASGAMSGDGPNGSDHAGGYDGSMSIEVTVV